MAETKKAPEATKTPEELAKEEAERKEKARAANVKATLESRVLQSIFGSNEVKSNPFQFGGELGYQSANMVYNSSMNSEEANKIKNQIYQEKLNQGKQLGVAGEPGPTSNYDVSLQVMSQINEVLSIARVGELEKAVGSLGIKLGFSVPDELKNYLPMELYQKAVDDKSGKLDLKKLEEKEQHALTMYQSLSEYYQRACAFKAIEKNYFTDLEAGCKKIADLYKKEEPAKPAEAKKK